ncbi:MAG: hypothetical protein NTV21_07185 [Planctomycetota bacterium]|nr:hypothetical protein [Planctomycetota bacterium]
MHRILRTLAGIATLSLAAVAQTGTLDQDNSSMFNAGFNGDAPSLIWQQEVQAGVAGTLEGVEVFMSGNPGGSFEVRIRAGGGWNTSPILFQTVVTQSSAGVVPVFINTSSANITLAAGGKFVFEIQGNGSGGGISGSYVLGNPTYPNFLYLGGPGCFADCGWRLAFRSYMLTGPAAPNSYCTAGTTTNGCEAEISANANPSVTGTGSCQILIDNVEGQKTGIIFYGLGALPQPWCVSGGSSFLCVKAPTARAAAQSSGGVAGSCDGTLTLNWNAFQAANPGSLGAPFTVGEKVYVQGWFRDPPACKATSLSDALEMTYVP